MAKTQDTAVENKKAEKKVNKNKKPNIFVRMWGKIKEVFSELKKVTWPSFATVMKQLGGVLVIIVIVLALIMVIDLGLSQVLRLIRNDTTAAISAVIGGVL